jgi:DNA invertase Pin-like site-specific DNA recombinase
LAGNVTVTTDTDLMHALAAAVEPAVWGYVRVSSDKQEDGQSPESQCDEIYAYCREHLPNLRVNIIQETASAGLPMFSIALPGMRASGPSSLTEAPRPLLGLLLAGLCERKGSQLVVWKLDRLARVATEQEMFLSLLRRHEVQVHTAYAGERHLVEGGASADQDPVRHLMRQILACFAEYERRLIHLRMSMGTRKKASKGGWIGGHLPYGYDNRNGELVIKPDEAQVVVDVFYMREIQCFTYRHIAETLAVRHGLPGFHKVRIMRIIKNRRLYAGIYDDPYGTAHLRLDLKLLPDSWGDAPGGVAQLLRSSTDVPLYE